MIETEDKLLEFIQDYNDGVYHLVEFKVKDYDDEYGAINEHFICKVLVGQQETATGIVVTSEKTCLVSVLTFKRWCDKRYGVIFLD